MEFLWLTKYQILLCAKCGAKFKKKISESGYWQLFETVDKNNKVWSEYGLQILTPREWVNIGNGGMSDQKQKVVDIEGWLQRLSAGSLKVSFKGVLTPVILKPGEDLLFALPAVTLKEPRAVSRAMAVMQGLVFGLLRAFTSRWVVSRQQVNRTKRYAILTVEYLLSLEKDLFFPAE